MREEFRTVVSLAVEAAEILDMVQGIVDDHTAPSTTLASHTCFGHADGWPGYKNEIQCSQISFNILLSYFLDLFSLSRIHVRE